MDEPEEDDHTKPNEREREFFEKLHTLCVEYNVSLHGNAEKVETAANYGMGDDYKVQNFKLAIDGREFNEIYVNHRDDDRRNAPAITSVEADYMDIRLVLHKVE